MQSPGGRIGWKAGRGQILPSTAMVFADPAEQLESGRAMGELPKVLRDILTKARTSWLRNQEVVDLLSRHRQYGFRVSKEPPQKPPGAHTSPFH